MHDARREVLVATTRGSHVVLSVNFTSVLEAEEVPNLVDEDRLQRNNFPCFHLRPGFPSLPVDATPKAKVVRIDLDVTSRRLRTVELG